MLIKIESTFPQLSKKLAALSDEIATKAVVSAINKTAAKGKTLMTDEIFKEFAIKRGEISSSIKIDKATFQKRKLSAIATIQAFPKKPGTTGSRNVIIFGAKTVLKGKGKLGKGAKWGVSVKIKRGGGRKLIEKAFIGNKLRTVFMRTGIGRGIKPVQVIGVPGMFNSRKLNNAVVKLIIAKLPSVLDHEVQFFLTKFNAK